MREVVRATLLGVAARFSDDAPRVDEAVLKKRYAALCAWPADAELGLCLLAWVLGPGFSMRGFAQAVNQLLPAFDRAADVVVIGASSPYSPTAVAIEEIVRSCFRNAAMVMRYDLAPEIVYWPAQLRDPWTSSST